MTKSTEIVNLKKRDEKLTDKPKMKLFGKKPQEKL